MGPVDAVTQILTMPDRAYRAVVLNHAMADVTFAELDAWATDRRALTALGTLGIDIDTVLAFRGEDVPADRLTVALAAGMTETEIRHYLRSGDGPLDALAVLAALRRTARNT